MRNKEFDFVMAYINFMDERGYASLTIDEVVLQKETVAMLEERKYKVEIRETYQNGNYTRIEWFI